MTATCLQILQNQPVLFALPVTSLAKYASLLTIKVSHGAGILSYLHVNYTTAMIFKSAKVPSVACQTWAKVATAMVQLTT